METSRSWVLGESSGKRVTAAIDGAMTVGFWTSSGDARLDFDDWRLRVRVKARSEIRNERIDEEAISSLLDDHLDRVSQRMEIPGDV